MGSIRVVALPVDFIELLWDRISPHLTVALEHAQGEATLETVKTRALNGDVLILTVNKDKEIVAIITLVTDIFDTGVKVLVIGTVGSASNVPMEEWEAQATRVIGAIAKDLNCTQIRAHAGRKGWARLAVSRGWKEAYVTYIHEVEL
jgi:hypothetical protein